MNLTWIDGRIIPADEAMLPLTHPAVRFGEGLMESMRAEGGRVALLDRHLGRIAGSAAALAIPSPPPDEAIRAAVAELLAALPPGPARLRLTIGAEGLLAVEGQPVAPLPLAPAAVTATAIRGAWSAGNTLAEHKTTSYMGWRLAGRRAAATGNAIALMLDADGGLGEADVANVFLRRGDEILTPPARGLLAGIGRRLVIVALGVREGHLPESTWRSADELVITNAVHGARALIAVDGAPVGEGTPGPLARRMHAVLRAALTGAAGP